MKWSARVVYLALLLAALNDLVFAEERRVVLPQNDVSQLELRHVTATAVRYRDSEALEVRLAGPYRGPDLDTFAYIPGLDFHDGTIEVDVAGSPVWNAPPGRTALRFGWLRSPPARSP
jgi:hypothetical protein